MFWVYFAGPFESYDEAKAYAEVAHYPIGAIEEV